LKSSRAAWIVLGLAIVLYYFRFSANDQGMMALYSPAGECLMRGERLVTCTLGFPYPPLFALLMVPFTFLPMWARDLIWYAVLVGATFGSFRLCERLAVGAFQVAAPEQLRRLRIFAVVLSLKFILSVFENQAYDVLVFFFILLGVEGLTRNRTAASAAGFALATALKATPALTFLYVLYLRRWKAFALGAALCALVSLLPDLFFTPKQGGAFLLTWVQDVVVGGLLGTSSEAYYPLLKEVNHLNQSLKAFVSAIVHGLGPELAARTRLFVYLAYLAYATAAIWVLVLASRVEGAIVWGASIVLLSMLMLSPMSSKSHFVVLLLPHMAIVAYLIRHREAWRAVLPLLCASFALNTLTSRALLGRDLANKMLSLGCITLGTLLLLAAVAVIVLRSRKHAAMRGADH
jgi:hypothetical protein